MKPNFVRMKVPESKKYLQVRRVNVAYKRRKELLNLSLKAYLYVGDSLIRKCLPPVFH